MGFPFWAWISFNCLLRKWSRREGKKVECFLFYELGLAFTVLWKIRNFLPLSRRKRWNLMNIAYCLIAEKMAEKRV